VQRENLALRVLIRVLEQDLSINAAWSDKCRIQRFDLVGCHNDLDIAAVIKAIELIQQLKHGSLNFALAPRCRLVPLRADGVDFINKYD
jgi:hypothetical protein